MKCEYWFMPATSQPIRYSDVIAVEDKRIVPAGILIAVADETQKKALAYESEARRGRPLTGPTRFSRRKVEALWGRKRIEKERLMAKRRYRIPKQEENDEKI